MTFRKLLMDTDTRCMCASQIIPEMGHLFFFWMVQISITLNIYKNLNLAQKTSWNRACSILSSHWWKLTVNWPIFYCAIFLYSDFFSSSQYKPMGIKVGGLWKATILLFRSLFSPQQLTVSQFHWRLSAISSKLENLRLGFSFQNLKPECIICISEMFFKNTLATVCNLSI